MIINHIEKAVACGLSITLSAVNAFITLLTSINTVIFTSVVVTYIAASAKPLQKVEAREYQEFLNANSGKGNLLTVPKGKIPYEALVARQLVQEIVENLAGDRIRAKKMNLVINIYTSSGPNAWVTYFPESLLDANKPKKSKWTLRKWWQFNNSSNMTGPIYELGLTMELLKKLKTQDELAWILGHELTHLLNGHIKPGNSVQKVISDRTRFAQSQEIEADLEGVDMIKGKYDPRAALTAIFNLMESDNSSSEEKVLSLRMKIAKSIHAAADDHHQEGLRVTLLQVYVEELLGTNPALVAITDPRPLPEEIKTQRVFQAHRENAHPHSKDWKIFRKKSQDLVNNELLQGKLPTVKGDFSFNYRSGVFNTLISQSSDDVALVFDEVLKQIQSSGESKQRKVDTWLHFLLLYSKSFSDTRQPFEFWDVLTEGQLKETFKFLAVNSSGEGAWNAEKFLKQVHTQSQNQPTYSQEMELPLLGSIKFQEGLRRLIKVYPEWQRLYESLSNLNASGSDWPDITKITKSISNLKKLPQGPLRSEYKTRLIKELESLDETKLFVARANGSYRNGDPEFILLLSDFWIKSMDLRQDSEMLEIERALNLKKPALAEYIYEWTTTKFESLTTNDNQSLDLTQIEQIEQLFRLFGQPFDHHSLPPDRSQDLSRRFISLIDQMSMSKTYFPNLPIDQHFLDFMSQTLIDNSVSRESCLNLIRLVTSASGFGPYDHTPLASEAKQRYADFLETLSKEEALSFLTQNLRTGRYKAQLKKNLRALLERNSDEDNATAPTSLERQERIAELEYFFTKQEMKQNWYLKINFLKLIFLVSNKKMGISVLSQMSLSDFNQILSALEKNRKSYQKVAPQGYIINAESATTTYLLRMLAQVSITEEEYSQWLKTYRRIMAISEGSYLPAEDEFWQRIHERALVGFDKLPLIDRVSLVRDSHIRTLLGTHKVGEVLSLYVNTNIPPTTDRTNRSALLKQVKAVLKIFDLPKSSLELYTKFRNRVTEVQNLQPDEIDSYFPPVEKKDVKEIKNLNEGLRSMSALLEFVRTLAADKQIECVDYLLSRSDSLPKEIADVDFATKLYSGGFSIEKLFLMARQQMNQFDELRRTFVINSILSGPNGILSAPGGLEQILNKRILVAVSAENMIMAEKMIWALMRAEGINRSLIISYVLAQKPSDSVTHGKSESLTEALVLKALLDFYGAPGIKLAQYLAFTNEFKKFESILEVYQDAALPVSYYDAIKLLQEELGTEWDGTKYRVTQILGSGSINLAIGYENLETGLEEVVNISRKNIKQKTDEDFRRFKLLIAELVDPIQGDPAFGFLNGLIDIIRESVETEFDRQNAYEMQKAVQSLYERKIDDWNVQTVDALRIVDKAIYMEKAPGTGARNILKSDPKNYQSAMRALLKIELEIFHGINETGMLLVQDMQANPDLHDGQVLIDTKNKIITVLDFGQTVKISNQERELGLDILRIVSGLESAKSAKAILEKAAWQFRSTSASSMEFDTDSLRQILARTERMDRFVQLISLASEKGFKLPIASVHYVLSANRLIALGKKVNVNVEASILPLLVARKANISVSTYNQVRNEPFRFLWSKVNGLFSSLFSKESQPAFQKETTEPAFENSQTQTKIQVSPRIYQGQSCREVLFKGRSR